MISTFLESFPLSMQIRTVIHMFYRYVRVLRELILLGLSSNISSRRIIMADSLLTIQSLFACLLVSTHLVSSKHKHKFSMFCQNVLLFTYIRRIEKCRK